MIKDNEKITTKKCCFCNDELITEENLKDGLCSICKTFFIEFEKDIRIEKDIHTNNHYDLIKGRMWIKGNGTGKYWTLLCNSRESQKDARMILGLGI